MKSSLTAALISLTLAAQPAPSAPTAGGYSPLQPTEADQALKHYTIATLEGHLAAQPVRLRLTRVQKVEKQIVNGTNLRLTCILRDPAGHRISKVYRIHIPLPAVSEAPVAP